MVCSNKVYTAETQDKGDVPKEEFCRVLSRSIPVCTGYQQIRTLSTVRKKPHCYLAGTFLFHIFFLQKHSKSLWKLTKIDSHASYVKQHRKRLQLWYHKTKWNKETKKTNKKQGRSRQEDNQEQQQQYWVSFQQRSIHRVLFFLLKR